VVADKFSPENWGGDLRNKLPMPIRIPQRDGRGKRGIAMPGKQIRNWNKYHALRRKGMSKTTAAKIANSKRKRKR
jgi:hypothetical protein